jgi:hypothetical protein
VLQQGTVGQLPVSPSKSSCGWVMVVLKNKEKVTKDKILMERDHENNHH